MADRHDPFSRQVHWQRSWRSGVDLRRHGVKLLRSGLELLRRGRALLRSGRALIAFSAASLVSAGIDFTLVLLLRQATGQLLAAVLLARLVSATVNYLLNRTIVFRSARPVSPARSFRRYALLACLVLVLNYLMLRTFCDMLGMPLAAAKLLTEFSLWLLSFQLQKRHVFASQA